MREQVFGLRRSRAVRKPSVQCPKAIFYRCEVCDSIYQRTGWAETESGVSCCGEEMEVLVPVSSRDLDSTGSVSHRIIGGYNDSIVQVFFRVEKGYELEWLYLKTFTGGYVRYIIPGERPPCMFALADEDAFSYYGESSCLEYTFWHERGFVVYGYVKGLGLVEMSLDQVSPYWRSGAKIKG